MPPGQENTPPVEETVVHTVTVKCPNTGPMYAEVEYPVVCLADVEAFCAALRRHGAPSQTVIAGTEGLEVTLNLRGDG